MNVRLILNFILSDWRSGELGLLLTALAIAVGTVTAITLTVDRLEKAMVLEASSFLGADRTIDSRRQIPEAFITEANALDIGTSYMINFNSMVLSSKDVSKSQLASVKAVEGNYPLRGSLRIASEPFGPTTDTTDIPGVGEIWINSRLISLLGVELGDFIEVGYAQLRLTGIIESEPDRGFSFLDVSPRVLMRREDIEATRVIQPGSQIDYRLLLVGSDDQMKELYGNLEGRLEGFRWRNVRDSEPRIGRALDRAQNFFLIGGSMAVLLAGVAIALSANRYAHRHFDHIGILKTLGSRPRAVFFGCIGLLLFIGLIGIAIGLMVGAGVHFGLVWYLSEYVVTNIAAVPPAGFDPVWTGIATGLICLFAFALPPFLDLINISPLRVIRRDFARVRASALATYGCAAIGSVGLLIWYSSSVLLTTLLLLGIVSVIVVFGLIAIVLLRSGRLVGMQAGNMWRLALSGLQRRYIENTGQIVVFSVAIMLLLIIQQLRSSLIDDWEMLIPDGTPNHVIFNIAEDQYEDVATFVDTYATSGEVAAFYDGRLIKVNGMETREYQESLPPRPPQGPRLSSRRQLTWSAGIPNNNEVIEGQWWSEDSTEPLVSIEQDYAQAWSLKVGDELTFRVRGQELNVTVSNLRQLEWAEAPQFNFFYVFSPSVFEGIPASYRSLIFVPEEHRSELSQLIARNPTMTVIDVDSVIKQVQSIIDQVSLAVEWILILVMSSGALVLLASIQASRDLRIQEHALVRSMGGTRKLISGSLTTEFLALGVMAGLVAVVGAELSLYLIETEIFVGFEHKLRPMLWIIGPLLGGIVISSVGFLATRKLVKLPPMSILRGTN